MKLWLLVFFLCTAANWTFSLDREAFTFTDYRLDARIEPEQQRLAVRGRITLRNDSGSPQKNAVLQISSSLSWRSIQSVGKPLQFVTQPYESDVDHTGELSEAIVTLPHEVAPGQSVDLDVGYEGVLVQDATRLTRMGMPKEVALHSDWDQIGKSFTAVRGVGYVTWYPVAMEAASLSDGNAVFDTLTKWKARHAESKMDMIVAVPGIWSPDDIEFSGTPTLLTLLDPDKSDVAQYRAFHMVRFGRNVPCFLVGSYQSLPAADRISTIKYLPGHEDVAIAYSKEIARIDSSVLIGRGFKLKLLQLADANAAPFASEGILLTPLESPIPQTTELAVVYAGARQEIYSLRPWIQEGLAYYAQAAYLLATRGRPSALRYLGSRLPLLVDAEKSALKSPPGKKNVALESGASQSLVNTTDDVYLQVKAMFVWWMLHDMLGDIRGAVFNYQPTADKEPSYMQHLLEKQSKRDLEWFFDDWVYRDRGLPDFRVASVFPRKTLESTYITTVTIENLGDAGAEVPVTVRFEGGDVTQRLLVHGQDKASMRFETPKLPTEVVVNDGSVPESNMTNNTFKVETPAN